MNSRLWLVLVFRGGIDTRFLSGKLEERRALPGVASASPTCEVAPWGSLSEALPT